MDIYEVFGAREERIRRKMGFEFRVNNNKSPL
jgi:hypothetical protein